MDPETDRPFLLRGLARSELTAEEQSLWQVLRSSTEPGVPAQAPMAVIYLRHWTEQLSKHERGSSGSVVAVPERGLKVRIVTKHDPHILQPAHAGRHTLFRGLAKDPRVSTVLSGDHHQAVRNVFKTPKPLCRGWKILSSDLTSASDLLPHDLIEALREGLCSGARAPDWVRRTMRVATGP